MTRTPLILSTGITDARLSDLDWAAEMIALSEQARIDMLLLGDGRAAPFDPMAVANWLASRSTTVGLVPTVDTVEGLPPRIAPALSALDDLTHGRAGWQPSTLTHPTTKDSVPHGIDFVTATRSLWDTDAPILVQTDADTLWTHVAPDVIIIDMDSPKPPPGPKCLVRTFTALAGLDEIEKLYHEGIIDGIHLTPPNPRRGLQEFIDTMLPALIERGLIPAVQRTCTLRERLMPSNAPR